jgi:hypothetical protein
MSVCGSNDFQKGQKPDLHVALEHSVFGQKCKMMFALLDDVHRLLCSAPAFLPNANNMYHVLTTASSSDVML